MTEPARATSGDSPHAPGPAAEAAEAFAPAVDALCAAFQGAKQGDLASLAGLISPSEALAAGTRSGPLAPLHPPALALAGLVKQLIMDTDPGPAFALLSQTVEGMRQARAEGLLPGLSAFPAALYALAGGEARPPAAPPPHGRAGAPPAETPAAGPAAPRGERTGRARLAVRRRALLGNLTFFLRKLGRREPGSAAALHRLLRGMRGEARAAGEEDMARACRAGEVYLAKTPFPRPLAPLVALKDWLGSALLGFEQDHGPLAPLPPVLEALRPRQNPPGRAATPPGDWEASRAEPKEAARAASSNAPGAAPAPPAEPVPATQAEAGPLPAGEPITLTGDPTLLQEFITESREHLELASAQLLTLESDPGDVEALGSVFRAFHTVKGIAGFLQLQDIAALAHRTEHLLDRVRRDLLDLTPEITDVVFDAFDTMDRLIEMVAKALAEDVPLAPEPALPLLLDLLQATADGQAGSAAGAPAEERRLGEILVAQGEVTAAEVEATIAEEDRAKTGRKLGELLVARHQVEARTVAQALRRQHPPRGSPENAPRETLRVDYQRLEHMVDAIGELVITEAMINQDESLLRVRSEELKRKLHTFRQVSRQLQDLGIAIRMVPVGGTFQKMARLVRDLARKSGKRIRFHTTGEETEMDRAFVDKIGDPLVHMIRNSVDHGIESPAEREAAGKDGEAEITLRAFYEGGNILVELQDDGRGLDRERIVAKALERGLLTEGETLSDEEVYQIIFHPGFSTAAEVTDLSGRGVGMDVVKRNVESVRGQVDVFSTPGQGTRFRLTLPLTMALMDGMVVRVGRERFIFPVLSLVESLCVTPAMVSTVAGRGEVLAVRDRQVPLYRFSRLFDVAGAREELEEALVVVVEGGGRRTGVVVDELIGLQQTVVKHLGCGIENTRGFIGGAILADGRVALIVDVLGLQKIAAGR